MCRQTTRHRSLPDSLMTMGSGGFRIVSGASVRRHRCERSTASGSPDDRVWTIVTDFTTLRIQPSTLGKVSAAHVSTLWPSMWLMLTARDSR